MIIECLSKIKGTTGTWVNIRERLDKLMKQEGYRKYGADSSERKLRTFHKQSVQAKAIQDTRDKYWRRFPRNLFKESRPSVGI